MKSISQKRDVALIVDDNPESLSMLNDTLDQAGITVLIALEGSQAITVASSITPDIILMDALMPNMDGFETCRRLKARRDLVHTPVIFMTGLTDTDSIVKGFAAGGVDYITKPVNSTELVARMKSHLTNARLAVSAQQALDSAGRYLFATDGNGCLQWATPQALRLFEAAELNDEWLEQNLHCYLKKILSPHYNKDKPLPIDAGEKPLEVRFIGHSHHDEILLQLIDPERPSESTLLRKHLPVTEREAEVLLWIARGKTNREIAKILSMSPRTVNKHLEQIFRKLNVENRTGAAVIALKYLESV